MTAACRETGLPPPLFEEIGTRFRVTLSALPASEPMLDTTDRHILDTLADGEGRSTGELAELIGLSTRATRTRLVGLIERGLVVEIGTSPQDPKRRYYPTHR